MNIETTTAESTTETAIGYIPCYNQPLFVCKKCGESKSKDLFVKSKSCKNGIRLICEKCEYENRKGKRGNYNSVWYSKNIQKRKKYSHIRNSKDDVKVRMKILHKKWKENNPGKHAKLCKEWATKNNDKIKKYGKKVVDEMPDYYIINRLVYCDGFKKEIVIEHPEIIETKRLILKTKRLCKTLQN
jgi:hypothetical protein